jgi:tetratricopeptide (TPR) repeat protein
MTNLLFSFILLFAAIQPGRTLYDSIDPLSVSQNLAFYELYPNTDLGQKALTRAWQLLNQDPTSDQTTPISLPKLDIQSIISLMTRQSFDAPVKLGEEQLAIIEQISSRLANRKLKGSQVWDEQSVLALPTAEIDLSRGLLIFQFDTLPNRKEEIRQYEASIDLMALQILARLPKNATAEDKIYEINRFIFQEMQFRFPPHSLHVKDIDLYTFLPSVLDSRQGVCLGVSILYLCLAQRLDLPLEIITPPGHIYIRYRNQDKIINIETTARGINLPSDVYLGIDTRKLDVRPMKEVIGYAFFNQASVTWAKEDYKTTVALYEKASLFCKNDPILNMLLGFNYIFAGEKAKGKKLLQELKGITFDSAVSPETLPDDLLNKKTDIEGIKAVFMHVDETRESILKKQKLLENHLHKYPQFRAGLLQLAVTYLQLGRGYEALQILQRYHKIDPHNASVEYYLAILSIQRYDYNRAWDHLRQTEKLAAARNHNPKALKSVRQELRRISPETL